VLGHAETLLAADSHLITNESRAAHFLHPGAAAGPSFMLFAETTIREKG
jgi:hypothetical protein